MGPRSPYGPKHAPGRSHSLTLLAKRILDAATERTGVSESNVVEHLVRLYAGGLTAEEFAPIEEEKEGRDATAA